MRNLALISSWDSFLPSSSSITSTTIDLDENVIYVASEHNTSDGGIEVGVWRMNRLAEGSKTSWSSLEQISIFQAVVPSDANSRNGQIISFRFMAESRRIAAIMHGGDVIMISIEEEGAPFEVEGNFESGILAASWSPDESVLAIVSGEHKLILLTSLFDVLSEKPLHVEDFGEDAPINVGWGSKQTQFHGSLGKTAAQTSSTAKMGISPDDDYLPRISWRGDCAFFVVTSLSPAPNAQAHRTLRVYDRQGILQTTSEDVPGLEHPLVWRPSGNLIAGTQRFGFEGGGAGREGRHDVIFFERNGLRHGDFTLSRMGAKDKGVDHGRRWGYKVRELAWNSDSNVLAIWIEGDDGDIVQFWTTGNYHWYLKHEISAPPSSTGEPSRFTSINWHPELALHFMLTTKSQVLQRIYSWDTFTSSRVPPYDSGAVAVVDGSNLLLTPFRSQNIPPPMSSYQLALSPEFPHSPLIPKLTVPIYVTFSLENDDLAILWESGYLEIWTLQMRLVPGLAKILNPTKMLGGFAQTQKESNIRWRQILLRSNGASGKSFTATVLGTGPGDQSDTLAVLSVEEGVINGTIDFQLPYRNCRLVSGSVVDMYQTPDGELFTCTHEEILIPVARFSEFCVQAYKVTVPQAGIGEPQGAYLGLAKSGRLYVSTNEEETRTMASNVISIAITPNFVIFTTTAHEAIFAPLGSLPRLFDQPNEGSKETPSEWTIRKVERGSKIVVAVPSNMSLVLQMPRGNLETINPRPLVMEVVKHDLDVGNYRKAFFACRKHRIDFNVIVDHDPEKLSLDICSFIDQIPEVDHLNLFLTLIGRGDRPPETIATLCDAFRDELEKRDLTKYVNSILTAHVVKTPPDHEAGLALLLRVRDSNPDIVEDAVKYIIFLVDADRLFDTALGMYDFSLVLMIAQHAQKDPREYLPFLRELRALEKYYQRFKIDDHLKRYQSALKNLSLAGLEHFDEAVAYVEQHQLYEYGLSIWKGTDQYEDILNSYGDWLFERREFRQAAAVFVEAKRTRKAMIVHEKALEWQELFNLVVLDEMDEEDIVAMGYRVAEDLSSKKRHAEAARVLLDYSKDSREAVIALVQGNGFSEARRIISLNSVPELLEDVVHPALMESREQISEDIAEMKEQIQKQLVRLRELRIKKIEEPDLFYGDEDDSGIIHNVDVMTDVSAPATVFTRYTIAPTSASRASRQTSRSKRKMERKIGSGRKGTVDEEEYLLKSVTKLVDRFLMTKAETRSLLPHLLQFTVEHREEGLRLQNEVEAFEVELKECIEEIWTRPVEAGVSDGWAARMAEVERNKAVNPLDKVAKPDLLSGKDWRMNKGLWALSM